VVILSTLDSAVLLERRERQKSKHWQLSAGQVQVEPLPLLVILPAMTMLASGPGRAPEIALD
jgi:hypothetical protein